MGVVGSSPTPGTVLYAPELRTERAFSPRALEFPERMVKGMFPIIVEAIRSMRLKAVRCTECGDARWCLFTTADPTSPCELCGGEMKVERRTPGGGPRQLLRERRDAAPGLLPGPRTPLTR
jgi:ribosomal protein S27E